MFCCSSVCLSRGSFINGICPAWVVGTDNREPAISTVHMLSFIFDFLCFFRVSPGLRAKVGRENRLWLIGRLSRGVRELPWRDSCVRSVATSLLFIVKGEKDDRSSMIRFLILTTALVFGERRLIPARSIRWKVLGIPRCMANLQPPSPPPSAPSPETVDEPWSEQEWIQRLGGCSRIRCME